MPLAEDTDDVNELVVEVGDVEGAAEVGELVVVAGVDAWVLVAAGVLPGVVDMLLAQLK